MSIFPPQKSRENKPKNAKNEMRSMVLVSPENILGITANIVIMFLQNTHSYLTMFLTLGLFVGIVIGVFLNTPMSIAYGAGLGMFAGVVIGVLLDHKGKTN